MELVSLSSYLPLPEEGEQYPIEFIESHSAIKLKEEEASVLVGVTEAADPITCRELKSFHKKKTIFFRIERSDLAEYLGKRLSSSSPTGAIKPKDDEDRHSLDKLANDAPIVNLVNSLLIEGIRKGASDIHIEGFGSQAAVRFRIDGVLQPVSTIDIEKFPAVSSRIKIMANLNIMERRLPQDGRVSVDIGGQTVDLRVSIIPIAAGESIVLRLFNSSKALLSLDEIGFSPEDLKVVREILTLPNGLFLVTGPTGSGKTTTLNAALRELDVKSQKIITIEDPVEYVIDGINQIQTNEKIGLTFDTILRRVLRQDPNIIMVGEIRDAETAELAVRSALTGHLVLSTLHTNDSVSVIPRLSDMGVEPYLLAAVLRGALAQRLVRRICPRCKVEIKPTEAWKRRFREEGVEARRLYQGKGCEACGGTGYKGRLAIGEQFRMTKELEEMIVKRERGIVLAEYLKKQGMTPLLKDGFMKAASGLTTIAEVEAAVMI